MADFKNEYRAAMDEISPNEALIEKIKQSAGEALSRGEIKRSPFQKLRIVMPAAFLLTAAVLISLFSALIVLPIRNAGGSEKNGDYVTDALSIASEPVEITDIKDNMIYFDTLVYFAENGDKLTLNSLGYYADPVFENGAYTVTMYGYRSAYTGFDSDEAKADDVGYKIKAFFYDKGSFSKPFSLRVSKNIGGEGEIAFDDSKGVDLMTNGNRFEEFTEGEFEETFIQMTVVS